LAKLQTEFEITCPCCQATLVVDADLRRVVRHTEPERADKPQLDDAHRILADAKARRESLFEQSVQSERTRGDALSRRFEEALKQAREEPITKPSRDFDLDSRHRTIGLSDHRAVASDHRGIASDHRTI